MKLTAYDLIAGGNLLDTPLEGAIVRFTGPDGTLQEVEVDGNGDAVVFVPADAPFVVLLDGPGDPTDPDDGGWYPMSAQGHAGFEPFDFPLGMFPTADMGAGVYGGIWGGWSNPDTAFTDPPFSEAAPYRPARPYEESIAGEVTSLSRASGVVTLGANRVPVPTVDAPEGIADAVASLSPDTSAIQFRFTEDPRGPSPGTTLEATNNGFINFLDVQTPSVDDSAFVDASIVAAEGDPPCAIYPADDPEVVMQVEVMPNRWSYTYFNCGE